MTPPDDAWVAISAWLQGLGQPELPKLPGHRHVAKPEAADRHAQAWEALHSVPRSRASAWTWCTSKSHEVGR